MNSVPEEFGLLDDGHELNGCKTGDGPTRQFQTMAAGTLGSGNDGTNSWIRFDHCHRFVALFFICLLTFGVYFCYDNPAALQDNILRDMELSYSMYGLLYSVYSWPNVAIAFVGVLLIDGVFGVRSGCIFFAALAAFGQALIALGAYLGMFVLMVIGRFIFAFGGEPLTVAQNAYAAKWFKSKELNFVFGITLGCSRLGSTANIYAMKPIYSAAANVVGSRGHRALGGALSIATMVPVVSFFSSLVLLFLDRQHDAFKLRKTSIKKLSQCSSRSHGSSKSASKYPKLKSIVSFPVSFWLLCLVCVAYYSALFPLVGYGLIFYKSKFQLSTFEAEICNSMIYAISMFAAPVFGFIVDRTGRNLSWLIASILVTILGHRMLAFTFLTPFASTAVIGVAYSVVPASLWPSVAYVVSRDKLATAFGCMASIQSLGLGLAFLLAGRIVDSMGYIMLEMCFILWLCFALGAAIVLIAVDAANEGLLNMNGTRRKEILRKQEADALLEEATAVVDKFITETAEAGTSRKKVMLSHKHNMLSAPIHHRQRTVTS